MTNNILYNNAIKETLRKGLYMDSLNKDNRKIEKEDIIETPDDSGNSKDKNFTEINRPEPSTATPSIPEEMPTINYK